MACPNCGFAVKRTAAIADTTAVVTDLVDAAINENLINEMLDKSFEEARNKIGSIAADFAAKKANIPDPIRDQLKKAASLPGQLIGIANEVVEY